MNPPSSPTDRDELIRLHLPLAYRLAACFRGFGESYEDLVQTAEVGLVTAAGRFEPARSLAFRAFATPIITAELRRSVGESDAGPRRSHRRLADGRTRQINGAQRRISGALGRDSRVQGLARLLAVDGDVVADALLSAAGREAVTLNLPVRRQTGRPRGASVTPRAA
ncbi:MAG TPA: sigma factor [Solirubrobacteraceae bacterium]|jgi:RNA polymerase sigma-B factor|nr:sigma factor [Solirubrobacteraceae bacterium]